MNAKTTAIRFPFNERKAVQVAERLVHQSGGEMNYMALIKLLVLIDRAALLTFGRPITGDTMTAMKDGVVLSQVLDFVSQKKQDGPQSFWHRFIPRPAPYVYTIKYAGTPETSLLSEAELALIDSIYSEHRNKSQWELSELHHQLPEWKDAKPGTSSVTITLERILELEHRDKDEIRAIAAESDADRSIEKILSQVAK